MGFKLKIDEELCQGCGNCIVVCPISALSGTEVAGGSGSKEKENFGVDAGAVKIYDPEFCTGCGTCVEACSFDAIEIEVDRQEELETKLKPEQLWLTGDRARIYKTIKDEGPLSIEQISKSLGIPSKVTASHIVSLKSDNLIFEADRIEENHRVAYTYTTEPPVKEEEEEEEEAIAISIDPEKAERMRRSIEVTIEGLNTAKIKNMIEAGRLEKVRKELLSKLEEE